MLNIDSPKEKNPLVSIVIPTHQTGEDFLRCLGSIKKLNPQPFEIIVVFDGKNKSFTNPLRELQINFIETIQKRGPGCARNIGARHAKGDILFFIDSDVMVKAKSIALIHAEFQTNPQYSAIIGSYDKSPHKKNFLSQYKNLMHYYVHQNSLEEASTFWGACGVIKRDIFLEAGGFDESYTEPSIEDIELGYRLRNAGHKIKLCKQLQVKHLKKWSVKSLIRTDFFCRALPWSKLIMTNKIVLNDLNLKTSQRLSTLFVYAALVTLLCSFMFPESIILGLLSLVFVIILNLAFYRFFQKNKGIFFAIKVFPWHILYYFYSGLAFGISFLQYHFSLKKGEII